MTVAVRAPINAEQKNANRRARVLIWGAALIVILNGLFPLVWIFLTSLKPEGELGRLPITYLPHTWTLQNYATVLGFDPTNPSPKPFWRWFFNSVFIAVCSSFFAVLVSSLVAYVVARMNIKGKGAILGRQHGECAVGVALAGHRQAPVSEAGAGQAGHRASLLRNFRPAAQRHRVVALRRCRERRFDFERLSQRFRRIIARLVGNGSRFSRRRRID